MDLNKVIFIVGPTAVGKSEIALLLAQRLNGEIVSCDSMQVYREINIASAKPSIKVLEQLPHHLIDVVSIEQEFDVVQMNRMVNEIVKDVHQRNRIPIIVGGSGLYMQILLDGIFEGGKPDSDLRDQLKQQAQEHGVEYLYAQLNEVDPQAAQKIHPNDLRRIIRALEVNQKEQKPISEVQKDRQGMWGQYDIELFCLNREREALYERINNRVDQMVEMGLIDEIKGLIKMSWSKTAFGLIGIQEIFDYLHGQYDLDYAKHLIKQKTRRFAKRQLTWFRKEKRLTWVECNGQTAEQIAESIEKKLGA